MCQRSLKLTPKRSRANHAKQITFARSLGIAVNLESSFRICFHFAIWTSAECLWSNIKAQSQSQLESVEGQIEIYFYVKKFNTKSSIWKFPPVFHLRQSQYGKTSAHSRRREYSYRLLLNFRRKENWLAKSLAHWVHDIHIPFILCIVTKFNKKTSRCSIFKTICTFFCISIRWLLQKNPATKYKRVKLNAWSYTRQCKCFVQWAESSESISFDTW